MTREEYVQICSRCTNRRFDVEQGVICGLTQHPANFQNECKDYQLDQSAAAERPSFERLPMQEHIGAIPGNVMQQFRNQQDLGFAIMGGAAAALAGAMFWALVTVITNYQIGYMAVAVGLLVGFAVRYFGSGVEQYYGFVGAFFALAGCALGNLFSQLVFIAEAESLGYYEVLTYLNMDLVSTIFTDTFSPMDILFYSIAAYEGFKFSFRSFSEEDIRSATEGKVTAPAFNKYRLPVVVALFVGSVALIFVLRSGYSGEKKYYYESGVISSAGPVDGGKEHGVWKTWWENGQTQSTGTFVNGKLDGEWNYYNESGQLFKTASYQLGMPHGKWITYFPNGKVNEEGSYELTRETGEWVLYNVDGSVSQKGLMMMGKPEGKWEYFYIGGKPKVTGYFTNGEVSGQWINWSDKGIKTEESVFSSQLQKIVYQADEYGVVRVIDGEGAYKSYYPNGNLSATGLVKGGYMTGRWDYFYEDGKKKEVAEYRNNVYHLINSWLPPGEPGVVDGSGEYRNFYEDGMLFESGIVRDGLRSGEWTMFASNGETVVQRSTMAKGLAEGPFKRFFESGSVNSEGNMKAGKQDGKWTWYFENGNVESTVSYVTGMKEGTQETFDEAGNLLMTEIYKTGVRQSFKVEGDD